MWERSGRRDFEPIPLTVPYPYKGLTNFQFFSAKSGLAAFEFAGSSAVLGCLAFKRKNIEEE